MNHTSKIFCLMPQRRERICYHELFKKNILQKLSDSVQNCAPLSALPEAKNRQQCKGSP